MNNTSSEKRTRGKFLFILFLIIILPLIGITIWRFEGNAPTITIDLTSPEVGLAKDITIHFEDDHSGLRKIWVALIKDGAEKMLEQKKYPAKDFIRGGLVHEDPCTIKIQPKILGISDGKAILRVIAYDYSWRHWWQGNQAYVEKEILIDTKPPHIDVLSRIHNISQGGAGLVIYRLPEKESQSGVMVGDNFFPGHPAHFKDPHIHLCFFALSYDQGPGTEVYLRATDKAGNQARAGFSYYLKRKKFRSDQINISDRFLQWKMPEFQLPSPSDGSDPSLLDKFLVVNRELRKKNGQEIVQPGPSTVNEIMWKGAFLRLPNSANRARFADHRTYYYHDKEIDREVHLGIDLASVAQSPVKAANRGIVRIADNIGIYGKTIVLDHGFGLFSTYSHLSQIDVKVGQSVEKDATMGHTGKTGLAGGDHLHFGMFIHNTFVNPVEWWDAKWIKNNITSKINDFKTR